MGFVASQLACQEVPPAVGVNRQCGSSRSWRRLVAMESLLSTLSRVHWMLTVCFCSGTASFKWHKQERSLSALGMQCSSYFLEPMQWMAGINDGQVEGKLLCPKCSTRLGSYKWAGEQCSCGAWVTPAFMLHKSKLDELPATIASS
eukprot:jgi/Chlat1/9238/Chrsp99S08514